MHLEIHSDTRAGPRALMAWLLDTNIPVGKAKAKPKHVPLTAEPCLDAGFRVP
jgi:hypothetical protein